MIIKKIKAKNFKTYLNLDLDLTVNPDKPIILIGGENGGGKTTLFEAIYGALYGLNINSQKYFNELLNAGGLGIEEEKIILELHFSGKVLNEEQQYVLTRTYMVNQTGNPLENVKLNMNGSIFTYGTFSPASQKAEQEAQVSKIIKANLPQELSRYFLFDAMEAGNLLKEDQLNRVIKENIENVMGFNKYMQMAKTSEALYQDATAQRIEVDKEKEEYLNILKEKRDKEILLKGKQNLLNEALQYSVANKEFYDNLKQGMHDENIVRAKITQAQNQIESIQKKEILYHNDIEEFVKEIEINVFIPKLVDAVRSEINLILKTKAEQEQRENSVVSPDQIEAIGRTIVQYLTENKILITDVSVSELVDYVIAESKKTNQNDKYSFLEFSEIKALEGLLNMNSNNNFPTLNQQQVEANTLINHIPVLETQIDNMTSQITGADYSMLKMYEDNESKIISLTSENGILEQEIKKLDKKLHQFDIQINQEPDPRYETLGKLKGFFEDIANSLLKSKKQQIELKMKQDLNINLAAYRGVIEKVELSENLKDLTFKIFHKKGNEIYLNQLNTASKQVVVQVLLKALHEFGDYDPPVMIDTVMGVLDETSRATVLENYFPELSHQTILLSSDSEIRRGKDYDKIEPFVSKAYTLIRDREKQMTYVSEGYFGIKLND